jgi:hypothetical protein
MDRSDIISYILIAFIIYICLQIYLESDYFNLKCIVSKEDGTKYCVRDRENLSSSIDLLSLTTNRCRKVVDHLDEKYPDDVRIRRLKENFNPQKINETLPTSEHTAYSENKGEKLAFCLNKERNGDDLIDINTLTFVALHELSHIMTKSIGHTEEFWTNFKFLIKEADIINIYKPIDYKKKPVVYCGMDITDNPLYDF